MKKISLNKITVNVFSYTFGQTLSLLFTLLSFALAARFLGVSRFGTFNYLVAVIVIITKLIDLGIAPNIFREYSINKNIDLINTGILLRISSFSLLIVFYNLICFFYSISTQMIILSNVIFFNLLISAKGFIRDLFEIPFKTDLKVHKAVSAMLVDNTLFLIMVLLMPYLKVGLSYFVFAYTISNVPGFFIMFYLIGKNYKYRPKFQFNSARWLLKNSFPIFIYVILNAIFLNIDLLLLKKFDTSYAVGIYSAATRLTLPLLIIPTAIIHTLFPQITNNYQNSPSKNTPIISLLLKVLFFISFGMATILTFKADEIIQLIYGINYIDSGRVFIVLLWSQIFIFSSFFVINLLVAYDKQKSIYFYSIITIIINVVLNIFLISNFSYMGATYAKLISIFVGFVITTFVLYRRDNTIYLFKKEVFFFASLTLIICLVISSVNLIIYLFITVVVLFLNVFVSKFFNLREIELLLKLFNKEGWLKNRIFSKYWS